MVRSEATLVKVCGLSTRLGVEASLSAGADALGFIFATSRRQVTADAVAELLAELDRGESKSVGVFVDTAPRRMLDAAVIAGIDILQLAGDENPSILEALHLPVWKVMRFPDGTRLDDALGAIDPWFSAASPVERVLIDGAVPGKYGGTGHRADWTLAREVAQRYPVILAGGLHPENVAEAIAEVRPTGVDTSSGVEVEGEKDADLIASFVTEARQSFSSSSR